MERHAHRGLLVTTGGGSSELGFVKAYDTADGTERWSLDLQEVQQEVA